MHDSFLALVNAFFRVETFSRDHDVERFVVLRLGWPACTAIFDRPFSTNSNFAIIIFFEAFLSVTTGTKNETDIVYRALFLFGDVQLVHTLGWSHTPWRNK